ncbi:MAG: integrase [Gammaproteobacteria bacterium]|jgi:integrase
MPRPSKGARLYWRKPTKTRGGQWVILDGKIERKTGATDRSEADQALADYIIAKGTHRNTHTPETFLVSEALVIYGEEHAPTAAAPERIGYALKALLPFWGELPVAAVTTSTCRRYAASRNRSAGTTRRELGTLRAALNYCAAEGYVTRAPSVHMPDKPSGKERWLTRSEVAALMRAARSDPRSKHLARFILLALYTGSRKTAVLDLRFEPHPRGGWIDCKHGVMYRAANDGRVTKKRKPPVRMPRKLLAHCRRWERDGGWAVNYRGAKVADIKTAWHRARGIAGLPDATPHTLKHTAITWAMQGGANLSDAAGYFGTSIRTLEETYHHHHPDFQVETAAIMDRKG